MDNRWTLHVEDFGKIEYADVTVAPLTLFVGDNNSGKSYLMTLLYTLLCLDFRDLNLCRDTDEYRQCLDWIMEIIRQADTNRTLVFPFDENEVSLLEKLLNKILDENKTEISRRAFNKSVPIGKLQIAFQQCKGRKLRVQPGKAPAGSPGFSFDLGNGSFVFLDIESDASLSDDLVSNKIAILIAYFLETILQWNLSSDIVHHTDVSFLPISRTGFLLTYPPLTGDAVSRTYGYHRSRIPNVQLTPPCVDFLKTIATINKNDGNDLAGSAIQFMEDEMIEGRIYVSNELPMPTFSYGPYQTEEDFPLFLSSGVVTELAPLLLLLQYTPTRTIFIEEPEMSLHPELQQKMARVLIRLANQDMPVFATTHSNTMIQHVNNMVKLSYLPEETQAEIMARFGFEPVDLISDKDISMCQFDIQENGRTMVSTLSSDESGFFVPTFKDALKRMLAQARATRQQA